MVPLLTDDDSDGDPTRRKSVLFCWECEYAGPIADAWHLDRERNYVRYVCPRCDTVLAEQPRTADVPALRKGPATQMVTAWGQLLQSSIELWSVPLTTGTASKASSADC